MKQRKRKGGEGWREKGVESKKWGKGKQAVGVYVK